MAKRDKLYTVNRWNKPLFEEERRRKLYLGGGDKNTPYGFNPYLHTGLDQALQTAGLYHGWGNDYQTHVEKNAASNQLITNSDYRGNYNPIMNQVRTYAALPDTDQTTSGEKQIEAGSLPQDTVRPGSALDKFTDFASTMTKSINAVKAAKDATNAAAGNMMSERLMSQLPTSSWTTATDLAQKGLDLYSKSPGLGKALLNTGLAQQSTDFTNKLAELSTLKLPQNTGGLNNLKLSVGSGAKGTNFLNTGFGKGVVMGGADLATDFLGSRISPKLNNTKEAQIGNAIGKVGSAVGSGLVATGYGLPVGLAVLGAGKLIGGLVKQFGSVKNDNGTSAYINRLNSSNPQGSDEFLANLWANTAYGPTATYTDGAFTDSGENWARERNEAVANAYDDYHRKIRHALNNNSIMRLQNAYKDNTWSAMGGKLNRKKCNCKAEGGILNTSINPVSAAGYDILSTYLTTQAMKNQANQDTGSSVGNSFMGADTGTLFANGGNIHINPAHKGEFTAKAKRHGMGVQQFANHVLAHKDKFPTSTVRQAVFAKNSHTWKKAFGGKLNYGKDKDIRDNSFFDEPTLFALGGVYQAGGTNWGNVSEINAGGTHEENPYEGVQVGVDPEGTPNLVEEGEVIWNDYVFSDRIKCPKEICKSLRVGVKKDGFTFAEVAKKLLAESKERPNDPISKRGLAANMQKLEDYQEEVKQKMEAEKAVDQFNSLPPEQQVAIMNQEGQKAQDAVAQEQMAQEFQSLPPEQQQAIAQQMMAEQAAAQGMPQGGSPEEQAMIQQQYAAQQDAAMQQAAAEQQYQQQRAAKQQQALAQAAAMQQQALNGAAYGGRLFAEGGMIPQEQPTEQTAEQIDSEMAKYSDEELQEMINEYEEAANGEKKVTKGRLARLRKKAERAERELERRNSQGENTAEEQSAAAQGQPQEPTQEQIQAAAQAQAQQQMMGGLPQEGVPLGGMSPEQAMMMQQLMGGQQMSPEEMAAAELQQLTGQQYAYGGKVNKYAYAGPLRPRPTSPFTEVQGAIYGKRPDIPQEVYDWFISLTPDERFDLFGGTDFWPTILEDYNEDPDNWYNDYKKNTSSSNRRYWRAAVTNEESVDRDNSDWHTIVLDAYRNRRDSSGKYVPYNLSQDIIHWYANLPEDERKKIVANTKMKGKDFSTVVEYANKGAAGPVTNAITEAYNAANGLTPVPALMSDVTSTVANTLTNTPVISNTQQTAPTQSVDYIPYFRGMLVNDILGLIWDLMSTEKRNGVLRNDFITNTSKMPTINWSDYNDELLNIYYGLHPEAKNSGWTFNNIPYRTYANVDFHDATSEEGNNGNKMVSETFYANDPAWNQLTEEQKLLKGNELAAALEGTQAYQDFSTYLRNNRNSQYVKDYFTELANRGSKIAKNALANWDTLTDESFNDIIKNLREDAIVPPNSPTNKNNNALGLGHFTPAFSENWTDRYWIKDADGNYNQIIGGIADADKDKYTAINTEPYRVTSNGINYNDYYYQLKTDADNAKDKKDGTTKLRQTALHPKFDTTGLMLSAFPGIAGLAATVAHGVPDTSELKAAAEMYANSMGAMAPPHLISGYIKPDIIDPRTTTNEDIAMNTSTNRLISNMNPTPSRNASILSNDMNHLIQRGKNRIAERSYNNQQRLAAADQAFKIDSANQTNLTNTDQFNAQMRANAGDRYAQALYNAAKEALDQRNAWWAGITGNINSALSGVYNWWRDSQNRYERDMLAASLAPLNDWFANYYGISEYDPETGLIQKGLNKGKYLDPNNPENGKYYDTPFMATPGIVPTTNAAKGGKLKRKNKKRRGFTF